MVIGWKTCVWDRLEGCQTIMGYGSTEDNGRIDKKRFQSYFSCVKKPWFNEEWLGRELNMETLERLKDLSAKQGIDLCSENGEYHTLVLTAPTLINTLK